MFDPTLPQENTPADAAQMRGQFNGLKDLIDALQSIAAAQVDSTATLPPDYPAGVSVNVIGNTLHFSFDIPRGADGIPGVQGPPFAQALVNAVNTLDPGLPAAVNVIFDGTNVHFTFDIPRGADGIPGEVTNVDLSDAISGTSSNTNAVNTLDVPFVNDPPTLADMETMRAAYNALVLGLRRL